MRLTTPPPKLYQTYAEKLRDPRWQRKRLEIFDRDGWRCLQCGNTTKELHVHHKRYIRGRDPWDYPNGLLATLCDPCHQSRHHTIILPPPVTIARSVYPEHGYRIRMADGWFCICGCGTMVSGAEFRGGN